MNGILQDLALGFRQLLKRPGFSAVVIFSLALGLGVNIMMFSFFNAYLLRPVPLIREPNRIIQVERSDSAGHRRAFSFHELEAFQKLDSVFSDQVILTSPGDGELTLGVRGERYNRGFATANDVRAMSVSDNYFTTLGVGAFRGRTLNQRDSKNSSSQAEVMISHGLWTRRFGSDPDIIGKNILLNNHPCTVIGVGLPHFSHMGDLRAVDAWVPLSWLVELERAESWQSIQQSFRFSLLCRLRTGVTPAQAAAALRVVDSHSRVEADSDSHLGLDVKAGSSFMSVSENLDIVAPIMTATGFVLLLACANVANLFLARAVGRQREMGVRLALGSSRWRIVQQLLIESVVLALIGGVLGLIFGQWSCHLSWQNILQSLPETKVILADLDTSPDHRVYLFALALSLVTGIIFGLAPALECSRGSLSASMKEDRSYFGFWFSHSRLRNAFAITQIAICFSLLIGAGVLLQSGRKASQVDFGFNPSNVALLQFNLQRQGYTDPESVAFRRRLLERLSHTPGVRSAGLAKNSLASREHADFVSREYFEALNIPLLRGRLFTEEEARGGSPVALISEATALRLWPGQNPIGQRMTNAPNSQIIGVTRNARNLFECLFNNARPTPVIPHARLNDYVYFPLSVETTDASSVRFVIRWQGSLTHLAAHLKSEVASLDPNMGFTFEPMTREVDASLRVFGKLVAVANAVGLVAILLSMMGIYGVMSFLVNQRTREIGIRSALGASRMNIMGWVMDRGFRLIVWGLILGIPGALVVSAILDSLLVGMHSTQIAAFIVIPLFLFLVAMLGCYLPARRAARILPMEALRYE